MWKFLGGLVLLPTLAMAQTEFTMTAADGVTVYADYYQHSGNDFRGTILLFHQADSNAAEYSTIAPRLNDMGFDAIAVDQRSGRNLFGATNRTVAARDGRTASYASALPDLEAALDYASGLTPGGPVIAVGSSYSASLVLILAARHPSRLAAVMSFSPGEYFGDLRVADEVGTLTVPVYLTAASTEQELLAATKLADAMDDGIATVITPDIGGHGASTLRPDTNPRGWEANWVPVEAFLDRVAP